ncbi:MAG TPA: fasciclin domain-containing protein, partial [Candidatus Thalassarchaeaceae archaeon]|nr:fasciclin domain-containing protein [Candidatus Thalassarchaeaceae archaeon]
MTAFLVTSPIALADSNDDMPTNATNTGVHDSLVDALVKADLVATLQGDGPFTVFAPTDQAFADAGIDLDSFTTDEEIAVLTDIL